MSDITTSQYTISFGENTTFNFGGTKVVQPKMSQSQANQFVLTNGFKGFAVEEEKSTQKAKIDTTGKASKSTGTKINGKVNNSEIKVEK